MLKGIGNPRMGCVPQTTGRIIRRLRAAQEMIIAPGIALAFYHY